MEYGGVNRINSFCTAWSLKMVPIVCPETSVTNYQPTPRNIPEERRPEFKRLAPCIICESEKRSASVENRELFN
jgi:hypothetical protein